jgi:hypothetical protein
MDFFDVEALPIIHDIPLDQQVGENMDYLVYATASSAGHSGMSGFGDDIFSFINYIEPYWEGIFTDGGDYFTHITCFFKKLYLYLYQKLLYVQFRAVCYVKPASKQYLPRCSI